MLLLENEEALTETRRAHLTLCSCKSAINQNTSPTALIIFLQGSLSVANAALLVPHFPKGKPVGS